MKTIIAFANTQGGKLIVGIDDKTHEIVGVTNEILFQLMDGIAREHYTLADTSSCPDVQTPSSANPWNANNRVNG